MGFGAKVMIFWKIRGVSNSSFHHSEEIRSSTTLDRNRTQRHPTVSLHPRHQSNSPKSRVGLTRDRIKPEPNKSPKPSAPFFLLSTPSPPTIVFSDRLLRSAMVSMSAISPLKLCWLVRFRYFFEKLRFLMRWWCCCFRRRCRTSSRWITRASSLWLLAMVALVKFDAFVFLFFGLFRYVWCCFDEMIDVMVDFDGLYVAVQCWHWQSAIIWFFLKVILVCVVVGWLICLWKMCLFGVLCWDWICWLRSWVVLHLNAGKTTFVKRHLTGEFEKKYEREFAFLLINVLVCFGLTWVPHLKYGLVGAATIGVEVHPLDFFTNCGKIRFYCWDTAGQEKFGGLRDGY